MSISYALVFWMNVLKWVGKAVSKKKNKNLLVKLVSTAGTGYFLVKKRNPKTLTEKLSFKKYDPKVRKHVEFKEEKIK